MDKRSSWQLHKIANASPVNTDHLGIQDPQKRQCFTELRTNDSRFIDMTKNAPFDRSADYIRFLLEAGCVRVNLGGRSIEPFEREYFDDTGMCSGTTRALRPLLAATVFKG